MATLTPTGASGTGTETLTYDLGANTSGSTTNYSFKLRQAGSTVTADTLTISQASKEVDVSKVELNLHSVTINEKETYSGLSAMVYPTNASDKRINWSTDDNSKVTVSNTGSIYGVALTSMSVGIKATSVADSTKYDYCYVTVVKAGSITVHDANALKNDTSVGVKVDLYNIDTNRPISITVTSGTSWVTNIGSYNASSGEVTLGIGRNLTTDDRSTTVTVTGYDLGGVQRTDSGTLMQNGVDDIALSSLSVSGDAAINDDGTTYHQYVVTYDPTNTSEKGVTWDVVDATTGNSVVGTIAQFYGTSTEYACRIYALQGANGNNVLVKATSTVRLSKSATQAVTVTYASAIEGFDVNPRTVGTNIISWDSTSDNTPVVTWSNIEKPHIKTIGGWSGFIEDADLETTNDVTRVVTSFSANSTTSSKSGQVIVTALIDGSEENIVVNYTQPGMPDPTTFSSVEVDNLTVSGGAKASFSATVSFWNNSSTDFGFPGSFYYRLYGYVSREDTSSSAATLLTEGTYTEYSDDGLGVRFTVPPSRPNPTQITLNPRWTGTLGMNTYFVLEISMSGYTIPSTDYDSTL